MSINAHELRSRVLEHLNDLQMEITNNGDLQLKNDSKEYLKKLHQPAVHQEINKSNKWITSAFRKYGKYFADGSELNVKNIKPLLVPVNSHGDWENDVWRLARYTWKLPYSQGFGRRMRYLVLDESNGKLIGIFGLQSPPINFPIRDSKFAYKSKTQKSILINQTMDIHTLGALMPYSRLLGGKMIALAAVSNEVRNNYLNKYEGATTEMERRILPANLIALTTTSAFGRSSIYNRLTYKDQKIGISLGYTEGYGHFHLEPLYPLFLDFLRNEGVDINHGYGTGPRRKWQLMRTALRHIGLKSDLLKHGIKREAFMFPLIHNLENYMNGREDEPQIKCLPFDDLSNFWIDRWLYPRASRVDDWRLWSRTEYQKHLVEL